MSASALNTLTFSFTTSLPLPAGALLTLTGLTGSQVEPMWKDLADREDLQNLRATTF